MPNPLQPVVQTGSKPLTGRQEQATRPTTQSRPDLGGRAIGSETPPSFIRLQNLVTGIQDYETKLRNALNGLKECQVQVDKLEELSLHLLRARDDASLVTRGDFWDGAHKSFLSLTTLSCPEMPLDCQDEVAAYNATFQVVQSDYGPLIQSMSEEIPSADDSVKAARAQGLKLRQALDELAKDAGKLNDILYRLAEGYLNGLAVEARAILENLPHAQRELQDEQSAWAQAGPKSLTPASAVAADARTSATGALDTNPVIPPAPASRTLMLTGPQIERLLRAMQQTYITKQDLEELLFFKFNEHLENMASSDDDLKRATTKVIVWYNTRGHIAELLVAVREHRGDVPAVRDTVTMLLEPPDLQTTAQSGRSR